MDETSDDELAPDDDVPIVEWEIPALRKVIPPDLQAIIGVASPVVRVSGSIDQKQRRKHSDDLDHYEQLTSELRQWEFVRKQPPEEAAGSREPRWQVVLYFDEREQRIPLLTILELRPDGVLYLRSLHRRQPQWGTAFEMRAGVVKRRNEG